MNLHRFLAYTVLACWIGLTAVTVGTALQWSAASSMTQVKVQRAFIAQKDASAGVVSTAASDTTGAADDAATAPQIPRTNDRAVAKAEAASDAMGDALNFEAAERKQFWWELGVWGCLTLLTSALLAERRDSEERSSAHK
ncbi:MAG: hypothetical protein WA639_22760 [Candidatus Acidiferrum sp.]